MVLQCAKDERSHLPDSCLRVLLGPEVVVRTFHQEELVLADALGKGLGILNGNDSVWGLGDEWQIEHGWKVDARE